MPSEFLNNGANLLLGALIGAGGAIFAQCVAAGTQLKAARIGAETQLKTARIGAEKDRRLQDERLADARMTSEVAEQRKRLHELHTILSALRACL